MNMPGYVVAEKDPKRREYLRNTISTQASRHLTICEQLRFVYDDVAQLPKGELRDSLTEKLIDAINMGKKMNLRLVQYKKEAGKDSGSGGAHLISLDHTQKRKKLRGERNEA